MKLGIFSDLHLEFRWKEGQSQTWQTLLDTINSSNADFVINAGDTHPIPETRNVFRQGIQLPNEEILGNHDFYGLQKLAPSRFVKDVGGLKIVGTTLWTDFNRHDPRTLVNFRNALADAHQIMPVLPHAYIANDIYDLFQEDLKFIVQEKPDIVITHHAPSFKSVHPKFHHTGYLNFYFYSDLDQCILDNPNIRLWVHAHMHDPVNYTIGNCQVVSNPLGYPRETYKAINDYQVLVIGV